MRIACLCTVLLAVTGCISSARDFAHVDPGKLPADKILLVGTFRVSQSGADATARTTIEATGTRAPR